MIAMNPPDRAQPETIGRSLAAALVLYALALLTLPLALDPASFHRFFSEQGPVEIASLILWPLAAVVVLASVRPHSRRTWAFALLYPVFAAREADLHKAFTAGSIFKSGYYRHVAAPLAEKLVAGIVAIAIVALLLYVLFVCARYLLVERGWRTRAGRWLLAAMVLLFVSKVFDRAPAVLAEDYGILISPLTDRYFTVFEEGIEAIPPLLFGYSAWLEGRARSYL